MVVCFSLGGRNVQFAVSNQEMVDTLRYLLRYHHLPCGTHPDVCIQLVRQESPVSQGYSPICLSVPDAGQNQWVWSAPSYPQSWTADHFFYWVLSPLLSRIFATLQLARLHGALLFEQTIGTFLLLGQRGSGKSSTVASWLECGGGVVTDDTPLLRQTNKQLACYGLQRELHIDPFLFPFLSQLPELREAKPYLPGKQRVAYDWKRYFGSQSKEVVSFPQHIIACQVDGEKATSIEKLSPIELERLVQANIREDVFHILLSAETEASILEAVKQTRGWSVTWGKDIWSYPGKHRAFLLAHLLCVA